MICLQKLSEFPQNIRAKGSTFETGMPLTRHEQQGSKQPSYAGENMARPKKQDSEKLTHTIAWRVTEAVKDRLDGDYRKSGKTQSDFLRDLLEHQKATIVAQVAPSKDLKQLVYFFNKASNNINQLAHRANAAELDGTADEKTYRGILAALEVVAAEFKRGIDNAN